MMLARLLRRARSGDAIAARLYGAIVAQARSPALYVSLGVPDTVAGRLEMIFLHSTLVLERLGGEGEAGQELAQGAFDAFVADMDRSLREMGTGDLAVPKRMKAIGASFYGRLAVYGDALAKGDRVALADALARNLGEAEASGAAALAGYALAARASLAAISLAALRAGELGLPEPAAFAAGQPA